VEGFSHRFIKEYSLLVCLSSKATSTNIWYIDNVASCHIIGVREYFKDLTKIRDLEVVLGDE
jgi:hypothetical protein